MSTVVEMSVHRALGELKLLSAKIQKATNNSFVYAKKKNDTLVNGRNVEELRKQIEGNFDAVVASIENRKRIKSKIVESNAQTFVTIAGKKYSVAEAIERKASLSLDTDFLNKLKSQFVNANNIVERENSSYPGRLEAYLTAVLPEKNRTPDAVESYTRVFEDTNKYELVDPKNIRDAISKIEDDVTEFMAEVDYVLSESNALTMIKVELV